MLTSARKANLSFPILLALVIGNMVGSGIFMLPSALAAYGTISLVSWLFTAGGAVCLALTFAHLNQKLPQSGGPYAYSRAAYGDFVGFLVAYTYWISLCVANAGIAVSAIGYLGAIWPQLSDQGGYTVHPILLFTIKVGAVWLFTGINILGIRTAGILQVFLTVLKLLPLILISVIGIFFIHPAHLTEVNIGQQSAFSAITQAATLTLWAFVGLETATIPSEETNGSRDVYRATFYGTLVAAGIYLLSTLVLMGVIAPSTLQHSQFPFADAATLIFGHSSHVLIAICAIIAGLGTLNVNIMLQGQIPMAIARDGLFPKAFAKLSSRHTPTFALVLSSCIVTILLCLTINQTLVKQFTFIAIIATLAILIPYFITAMAELTLLINQRTTFNPKQFLRAMIIAILSGAYSFWMIIGAGTEAVFYGALLILSAFPAYILLRQKQHSQ